ERAGAPLDSTSVTPVRSGPEIDTLVPTSPLVGENEMIAGAATVNGATLLPVPYGVVTEIGPVVAPTGTVACISESEFTTKPKSVQPLNLTLVAPVKFDPWMS